MGPPRGFIIATMPRAIVLGSAGMLGRDLAAAFERGGWEVVGLDIAELDLTDPSAVARMAAGEFGEASWCVNCAAYTAVDHAESDPDAALRINALAPSYIAQACIAGGMKLLHVSTDFVFDGISDEPYSEEAPTHPLGVYGQTKMQGEEAVLQAGGRAIVVRTAWLYGPHGKCFPKSILNGWLGGRRLRVVADQFGNPTYTAELARVLVQLVELDPPGAIYHASGSETMSWHAFAQTALTTYAELHGTELVPEIEPIRTEDWPTPARRPRYSALSFAKCASLGIAPMRPTRECLREFWSRLPEPA